MSNNFFDFDDDIDIEISEEPEPPKKKKKSKSESVKVKTLFDHLRAIYEQDYDPNYFDKLSESDKKTFSIYMINRFLSMYIHNKTRQPEWLYMVNYFQQYNQVVSPVEVYKFYASAIPKEYRIYINYIKGIESKFDATLIETMSKKYQVSKREAVEYLEIYYKIPNGMKKVEEICQAYGYTEKEIKKMIKLKE